MVYKEVGKRQTRKVDTRGRILFSVLLTVLMLALILSVYYFSKKDIAVINENSIITPEDQQKIIETIEAEPEKVDFQPIVDAWVGSVNGNKSIVIYDLERSEIAAEYNMDEDYNTASLYKLFVVYEGYRRLESGEWQADDIAGVTRCTIKECLDLAIRESYSPCAETLHAMIGYDELEEIVKSDFEITNTSVENLSSNPNDIVKMMALFYKHPDIKNTELVETMKDSFLNQPTTTYNWRQGLPSGFSDKVNVYGKVGWDYNADAGYWNVYHDAAIVEFPKENRHFVVVVMTNRVPYQKIRELGAKIEEAFYNN